MTSKNLYSKLMKEDLKSRLWAVSLISLGCFFLYPVMVAFEAGTIKDYASYEFGLQKYTDQIMNWLSFENGMTVFVMMLVALICGLSSFSYLNSKSKVDFYHSIPVKREKLYLANYLNGILMMAVPFAVSMALAVCVGISNGIDGMPLWKTALAAYGLHMTYYILMYTTVVIAGIMTGNLVVGFLGCMVFALYIPMATMLVSGYFQIFYHTYVWNSGEALVSRLSRFSPIMEYVYRIGRYSNEETVWTAALAALFVSAVLAVLGCFLYRKRPSEAAGRAMAFAVTRPVIRILLTLLCAMGLGGFFWSMRESTGWAVFGVVCGAVISHCIIEIIYHFDFKKLFANKGQLIACTVVSVAVLFVFRYDLTGYDRYLPSESDVKGAAVSVSAFNDWPSYGHVERQPNGVYDWESENTMDYIVDNMNYTDTSNLLAIAASGIEETARQAANKKRPREMEAASAFDQEEGDRYSLVVICYTLRSGRHVYRSYTVNLDSIMPHMEKLYASEEYKKGAFPLMTRDAENVAGVYYSEQRSEKRLEGLTAEEKKLMLDTYRKEFASMTPEQMKREYPVGLIRFTSDLEENALDWWKQQEETDFEDYPEYRYSRGYLSDRDYYPVYPSFKETIRLLKENQIDVGTYFTDTNIISVTVEWNKKTMDSWESKRITIVDPDEIAQIKQVLVGPGMRYYNSLFATSELDVNYTVEGDGDTRMYSSYFPKGQVPEFITSRLTKEN